MTDTYSLTPHESVTVRSHTPELLEIEATYEPGGSAPPKHLHPGQAERFELLAGQLETRVGDGQRTLRPGDTLDVPAGTPHQMWNSGAEPARVLWQIRPAGRTREWFATLDRLRREGRVGRNGMPGPLAFGVYLTEYRDVFRLAGPQPVLTPLLRGLGVLGRLKGYRPGQG
jgi:quercetin dioxygenase-like cupin family protein